MLAQLHCNVEYHNVTWAEFTAPQLSGKCLKCGGAAICWRCQEVVAVDFTFWWCGCQAPLAGGVHTVVLGFNAVLGAGVQQPTWLL